jgi:hypothetical protein
VPSEFGGPTDALQGLLGAKGALHAKFREVGPPLLLVYTGPFADYSWGQWVPCVLLRYGSKDGYVLIDYAWVIGL